jgi:hypothetical protein
LLGEANVENLISYFLPMLEKHLCLELKNYTIGALGRQKVNKVEPKHIHACKANLLHKRLHMHTRQLTPNPKSSLHSPPQNNTTTVAKSGKPNINNSVLSEGNRKYLVDQTREMALHAE